MSAFWEGLRNSVPNLQSGTSFSRSSVSPYRCSRARAWEPDMTVFPAIVRKLLARFRWSQPQKRVCRKFVFRKHSDLRGEGEKRRHPSLLNTAARSLTLSLSPFPKPHFCSVRGCKRSPIFAVRDDATTTTWISRHFNECAANWYQLKNCIDGPGLFARSGLCCFIDSSNLNK